MSKIENVSANDASNISTSSLSCLNCRKKKAKCSKTRPSCTRCTRSNQSCDYPDAPLTLYNLSEKVLDLYGTLQELEGEFLEHCIKKTDKDQSDSIASISTSTSTNTTTTIPHNASLKTPFRLRETDDEDTIVRYSRKPSKEVPGWSISLSIDGFTLQTCIKTISDLYNFIQEANQQISRDFESETMSSDWILDDIEDYEQEELDEDNYLVIVPIFPRTALLGTPTEHGLLLDGCDDSLTYPLLVSATLLAWTETEYSAVLVKTNYLIPITLRTLCGCDWETSSTEWLILAGALLYLDIYASIFQYHEPILCGEGSTSLQQRLSIVSPQSLSDEHTSILLECRLMLLFHQAVSLFYHVDNSQVHVKKVDVDILLTLVRDIEKWEHSLPLWARWTYETETKLLGLKYHMHMIHNMTKILLFRPFCTDFYPHNLSMEEMNEQTHTKTTFLDLSTASADRLVVCLGEVYPIERISYWTRAAGTLVRDVIERVRLSFDSDEESTEELKNIEESLICIEVKYTPVIVREAS
ncbi:hypothetical protein BDF14DRAFT_1885180 [Spinellus fusiger]|nr:hypothetical protein BDF14DRAFT_1885180 [Spinellus fusiger]